MPKNRKTVNPVKVKRLKKNKTVRSKSQVGLTRHTSIFDAPMKNTEETIKQIFQQKVKDIPLDQDVEFLQAIKQQLMGLKKRLRHETLQKLQLLKQIKEFRINETLLKAKVARLDQLEKGAVKTQDAEVQTDSENSDSNIRSFTEPEGMKLVPDGSKLKARQIITPNVSSEKIVAPAPAGISVGELGDLESNEQMTDGGSLKEDSKPQSFGIVKNTVTRANTFDAQTFKEIQKKNEDQKIQPTDKSPVISSPSHKRLSSSMFKNHMQKTVNFTDQIVKQDSTTSDGLKQDLKRTTSDGRTLTRTEYRNPNLKSVLDPNNMSQEYEKEKQVPPLQMNRFQVNYKQSERVKQMMNSRVSMHAAPTGSDSILRSYTAGDSLLRQVNLNFNAGPHTLRQTQTSPLDNLRQNFTINVNEGLSLDEYTYAWRQCDYWMQKAEQMRKDQAQWKNSRNQAWKENAQLQNLIKQKQEKIQELEKVITDFNLLHPNEQVNITTGDAKPESRSRPLSKTQSAQNVIGYPVPQIQQSLRISIPENTKYQYVPPLAPLTAKHAPLPELMDEEDETSYQESKDRDNSLYNSQKKFQSESYNQTNTYCMPNDKFIFNDDRGNIRQQIFKSGEEPMIKSYTFDSASFNRANNRKLSKAGNMNRMGVRFNDEEDGNGGEQHQMTGSYSYEHTTEKEDFVFETPKRHSMLFPMNNEQTQPRPDVTSNDIVNQYDRKEIAAKERLQKRTKSEKDEENTSQQSSQSRHGKKRSVFSNILRSIF